MKTLLLSGWSQAADALAGTMPGAAPFDYGRYDSVGALYAALAQEKPDCIIGWSLGGQLAVRAVADNVVAPQKLVLIAAPFQCAATPAFPQATAMRDLEASRDAFVANPDAMLRQFYTLCALGDAKQRAVLGQLLKTRAPLDGHHWLFWFDELVRFSCLSLDFANFPPTTLIYGEADCIVPVAQGEAFAARLPSARLHRFPACAHAPHLHDAEAVKTLLGI